MNPSGGSTPRRIQALYAAVGSQSHRGTVSKFVLNVEAVFSNVQSCDSSQLLFRQVVALVRAWRRVLFQEGSVVEGEWWGEYSLSLHRW